MIVTSLTDTGEDSKLVHRRKRPKVDALFSSLFFQRVRAMSMTQRRVEYTRVHFWTFSTVSVKVHLNDFRQPSAAPVIFGGTVLDGLR